MVKYLYFFCSYGQQSLIFLAFCSHIIIVEEAAVGLFLRVVAPLIDLDEVEACELVAIVVVLEHTLEPHCSASVVEVVAVDDDVISVVVADVDTSIPDGPFECGASASSAVVPVSFFAPPSS